MVAAPPRPEAIDSRLVFRIYAAVTLPAGFVAGGWPFLVDAAPDPVTQYAYIRIAAAVVAAFGCCAAALAAIDDPVGRRRALIGFANAHLVLGVMLALQWIALLEPSMPALVGWAPLTVGVVLLYLALTGPGSDFTAPLPPLALEHRVGTHFAIRNKAALGHLRSQYEQQIRQAARQEERARLARDLHDAVKQQLFAIQTAAATAQARFDSDPGGARAALEQVRTAGRDAMAEMEAMLDQLQASPVENAGLVEFLRKQCDALALRTGAVVLFDAKSLPDNHALDPGARQALARVAQEALSNVARHARATRVDVTLALVDGRFVLTVQDNGSGFQTREPRSGMGMANIAARASEVGGTLEVTSAPGAGTTLRFWVPVREVSTPLPYIRRAAVWSLAVILIARFLGHGGAYPWAPALLMVALIAVTRYAVAAYWLTRSPRTP